MKLGKYIKSGSNMILIQVNKDHRCDILSGQFSGSFQVSLLRLREGMSNQRLQVQEGQLQRQLSIRGWPLATTVRLIRIA